MAVAKAVAVALPPERLSEESPAEEGYSLMTWKFPSTGRATEVQFGQKWLLIGGIAITVFGLGFFLKYAFEQNWVGPAGRVVLSYLASAAFLGAGDHFRRKRTETFGLYLLGGGIAALYLTTFAASQIIYDMSAS